LYIRFKGADYGSRIDLQKVVNHLWNNPQVTPSNTIKKTGEDINI